MRDLLNRVSGMPGCRLYSPGGLPVCAGYELPDDLRAFYLSCGGMDLFADRPYGLRIVSPAEFEKANPVIRACEGTGDISLDWFIVALRGEQYVTIDLARERRGRCYDSFWDRHALRGSSPIIALSFTELLQRILDSEGEHWYWLRKGFQDYGDAYTLGDG